MKSIYKADMKYGHLLAALEDLALDDLHLLYREANTWDGSFEECVLYTLEELDDFIEWDYDSVREFISIGESDYYYEDCYGWNGMDLQGVRSHLEFWNADLAEWLANSLTLDYDFEDSKFILWSDSSTPWTFERDEVLITAAACDLAYAQGFIGLAHDKEKLEKLYFEL